MPEEHVVGATMSWMHQLVVSAHMANTTKGHTRLVWNGTTMMKPMFLLKMCDEWAEPSTKVMIGSKKYRQWTGGVSQELLDECP